MTDVNAQALLAQGSSQAPATVASGFGVDVRNFDNTPSTVLLTLLSTTEASFTVGEASSFPPAPFVVGIDRGTASQELCLVNQVAGSTFYVTRGYSPLKAVTGEVSEPLSHDANAIVELMMSAQDFYDANYHQTSPFLDLHPQYLGADGTRHDDPAKHLIGESLATGLPTDSVPGDVATAGSGNVATSDHVHGRESTSEVFPIGMLMYNPLIGGVTGSPPAATSSTSFAYGGIISDSSRILKGPDLDSYAPVPIPGQPAVPRVSLTYLFWDDVGGGQYIGTQDFYYPWGNAPLGDPPGLAIPANATYYYLITDTTVALGMNVLGLATGGGFYFRMDTKNVIYNKTTNDISVPVAFSINIPSTLPSGFIACDGSVVPISDYPLLFQAIGTTYSETQNPLSEYLYEFPYFQIPNFPDFYIKAF